MNKIQIEVAFLTADEALFNSSISKFREGQVGIYYAPTLSEFKNIIREKTVNAIILDSDYCANIFGFSAENAVAKLKKSLEFVVIIVILQKENYSGQILKLLEFGAHDVLTKPINPRIVAEQIKALVRVFSQKPKRHKKYFSSRGDFIIMDYPARKCHIKERNERREIKLTKIEFQILYRLLQKKDELVSFNDFQKNLWPTASSHKEMIHTLHQLITNIRKKIKGCPSKIENLRGEGFKLS
ncbi:MAG: winged helix-turn-helix domain-containing protein [Elusimicrobia bacterium]|nr:winged helix-turn-helix domain-containing protein [Elusimicrobiota bacterium]